MMQSDLKLSYIMIEVEDYADTITAERVKRVIDGYGEGKNAEPANESSTISPSSQMILKI